MTGFAFGSKTGYFAVNLHVGAFREKSMARAFVGLVVAVLLAVVAANYAYKATANSGSEPINAAWAQNRMEFVAWNRDRWTAWVHDSSFVQLPKSAKDRSRHANRSIAFIDWEGEPWQAKIDGEAFLLARRGDWQGPVEESSALRYLDWSGDRQLRTVQQLRR